MEELLVLMALTLLAALAGGGVCGIIALVRAAKANRRVQSLEAEVRSLRSDLRRAAHRASRGAGEAGAEATTPSATIPSPEPGGPPPAAPEPPGPPPPEPPGTSAAPSQPPTRPAAPEPPPPEPPRRSLEFILGTRWSTWVGVAMLLVAGALFIKYAYDNNWVGPSGRVAIGTAVGVVALVLAERFRRKEWKVLFQSLTGFGVGLFFICIFAAFQLYSLTGQTTAVLLSGLVIILAVAMAVAHDAVSIAVIGLIGGFISPVILSTGDNRPYASFGFVAGLGLIAMGAAIFRRWRALDFLCFAGTVILFQMWFSDFYDPEQMTPALLFTSVFYLMYLLIPTLYGLVRRAPATAEGLALVAANAVWSFAAYYRILYHDHRQAMGFVVLGQAVIVFLLFQLWLRRVGRESRTGGALLTVTLGLVTLAIPIQLKLYGIPLAWAMEGAVLVYLGIRFRLLICRVGGLLALLLSAAGLVYRLPLHTEAFTPVFNVPFGSWALAAAAAALAGWMLQREREPADRTPLSVAAILLSAAMACLLFSMEVWQGWTWSETADAREYQALSLALLWALIPLAAAATARRARFTSWTPLAWLLYFVGLPLVLFSFTAYDLPSRLLCFNAAFASRLGFVVSLWLGARASRGTGRPVMANVLESLGHGLLTLLLALEMVRWTDHSTLVSDRMGISLISAAAAVQAFALIWFGLATRRRLRRILGFVLFGLCLVKVLAVDTSRLREVYRIVSFLASGALLVTAAYFYQRYAGLLFGEGTDSAGGEEG